MPPRWNGHPAPSSMQRSTSWHLGDDSLVEHEADLLGQRGEGAVADLIGRRDASADLIERHDLGVGHLIPSSPQVRTPVRPAATSRARSLETP